MSDVEKIPFLVSGEGRIHPALLKAYGPIRAEMLQQVHYRCCSRTQGTLHEGYWWFFHRVTQWQDHFLELPHNPVEIPYRTMKRHIAKLKDGNAWVVGHFTKGPAAKTNWYRVNYAQVVRDLDRLDPERFRYELREGLYPTLFPIRIPSQQEVEEAAALSVLAQMALALTQQDKEVDLKMIKTPKGPTTSAQVQVKLAYESADLTESELDDTSVKGLEVVWRKSLLLHHKDVNFVPKWIGKNYGQAKGWLNIIPEHQIIPLIGHTLMHWGRFTKHVSQRTGFKNNFPAPGLDYFTRHIAWAMDLYLGDMKVKPVQSTAQVPAPKKGSITIIVKKPPEVIPPPALVDAPLTEDELLDLMPVKGYTTKGK